jgi:hypothetical protein
LRVESGFGGSHVYTCLIFKSHTSMGVYLFRMSLMCALPFLTNNRSSASSRSD